MNIQQNLKMGTLPELTYQDLLAKDTHPAPDFLAHQPRDLGVDPVPATNYTSEAFFAEEVEKVWMKTWQLACRGEDIPNVGDTHMYDLLHQRLMIVRQRDGGVRAFKNVCRHRGRKLVTTDGCKQHFKCPYHGMTWNLDGTFQENPFAWDFPQIDPENFPLFEVRCEMWSDFVFVNFDDEAAPLLEVLAPIPEHFERWRIDDTVRTAHVGKVCDANWKACAEAFLEAHHVICTHPQYNLFSGYDLGQHDVLSDHVTRFLSPSGVAPAYFGDRELDDAKLVSLMLSAGQRGFGDQGKPDIKLEPGVTSRRFAADLTRKALTARTGYDFSEFSDAESLDGLGYDLFPNFHLWGGFKDKISYRFRPLSHNRTLVEVMLYGIAPKDQPKPAPAPLRMLGPDDKWTVAEELGLLGDIFEQDFSNMGPVQEGLESLGEETIHFSKYLEVRCRNLHRMVAEYMAR